MCWGDIASHAWLVVLGGTSVDSDFLVSESICLYCQVPEVKVCRKTNKPDVLRQNESQYRIESRRSM